MDDTLWEKISADDVMQTSRMNKIANVTSFASHCETNGDRIFPNGSDLGTLSILISKVRFLQAMGYERISWMAAVGDSRQSHSSDNMNATEPPESIARLEGEPLR